MTLNSPRPRARARSSTSGRPPADLPLDEVRPAHAGAVRAMIRSPCRLAWSSMYDACGGADQSVKEEARVSVGIAVFPDLQRPATPHDEGIAHPLASTRHSEVTSILAGISHPTRSAADVMIHDGEAGGPKGGKTPTPGVESLRR